MAKASKVFYEEDGEVERSEETSHLELAKFVVEKSERLLKKMYLQLEMIERL